MSLMMTVERIYVFRPLSGDSKPRDFSSANQDGLKKIQLGPEGTNEMLLMVDSPIPSIANHTSTT